MRNGMAVVFAVLVVGGRALAQGEADSKIWSTNKKDVIDRGLVVSIPSGSSDFLNSIFDVVPGSGNVDQGVLADGLPVRSLAVSVTDFSSGRTYPVIGCYRSNLGLDPSGRTPDLSQAIVEILSPALVPPPLAQFVTFAAASEGVIPGGDTMVHAVVQLPPGDLGLLGVGADSTSHPGIVNSGYTTDGYTTPANPLSFLDLGIDPGQDNTATTSCQTFQRTPHGRLRASNLKQGVGEGDAVTQIVEAGDTISLAFYGSKPGDKLRFYFNTAPCTPAVTIGPVLSTASDPDGDGSYLRINATWPLGYPNQRFQFSAVWGNSECLSPGVGFTNCVTVMTGVNPQFGICDDGTVEGAWTLQMPAGPSDYFSNNFGPAPPSVSSVVDLGLSVLDFGIALPEYPAAGVSLSNWSLDPTGNTPDLSAPLAVIAPFTFVPLTFATTSLAYVHQPCLVPGSALVGNIHAWVQMPPGNSGSNVDGLFLGADISSNSGCSFASLDGFQTPATGFDVNWAIRLGTN